MITSLPRYKSDQVELYCGDCLEILPQLEAGSVDAVVTDPPYGMNYNYDNSRFTMGPNGHGPASSRKWQAIKGDNEQFDPLPWIQYREVILFGFNHFAGKLPIGTVLVWIKKLDGAFGTFLSDAELAWMKGGKGVYCFRDQSLLGEANKRVHPNQKPLPLMKWCISKLSGNTILDPFMGSGTTGVAAIQLGRRFIGIEIDEKYYQIAEKRIREAQLQMRLPL